MAISSATLTMNLADLLGVDFDIRRTKVWVSTNIPGNAVIDTVGNQIRLGTGNVTLNADGSASLSTWIPGTGANPASWQTYVNVDYRDSGSRERVTRTFGPFTITGNADLADLVAEQEIPPTYLSTVTGALSSYVTSAQNANTSAIAARGAAESARDAAQALVVSDLGTSDGQTRALLENPASQSAVAARALVQVASNVTNPYRLIGAEQNAATYADRQTKLAPFHDALLNRASTPVDVVVIADSIGELQAASSYQNRYMTVFRDALRRFYPTAGISGGENYLPVFQDSNSAASRWTVVSGSIDTTNSSFGLGRKSAQLPAGAAIRTTIAGTSFRVAFDENGAGSFTVKVGAAAAVTVTTNGTGSQYPGAGENNSPSFSLPGSGVATTVTITASPGNTGSTYINGLFIYDGDEAAGVRVHDSAHYGFTTQYFANDAGNTGIRGFFARFAQIKPQLVVIVLGTNERTQNQAPSVYGAYALQLINRLRAEIAQPVAFVLVKMYEHHAAGASYTYPMAAYAAQDRVLAAAADVCALEMATSIPNADVLGSGLVPDGIHPGDAIHGVLGTNLAGFVARRHPLPAAGPINITDSFTRADSATTLGSPWVALSGTWGIRSNTAYLAVDASGGGGPYNVAARPCGASDGTVSLDFVGTSIDAGAAGIAFRVIDANNYYGLRLGGGAAQLYKVVAGSTTSLGSFTYAHSSTGPVTVSVALSGSTIAVKAGGSTIGTVTDTFAQTATSHGLWGLSVSTGISLDNFAFAG